jgi:hypothetical protein
MVKPEQKRLASRRIGVPLIKASFFIIPLLCPARPRDALVREVMRYNMVPTKHPSDILFHNNRSGASKPRYGTDKPTAEQMISG